RRRHTRSTRDWSSDVCSSDLVGSEAWCGRCSGRSYGVTSRLVRVACEVVFEELQIASVAVTRLRAAPCVRSRSRARSEAESRGRSEEHTSELQSRVELVCRLL